MSRGEKCKTLVCVAAGEWTGSKPKTFTISFFLSQVFLDDKGYEFSFSS